MKQTILVSGGAGYIGSHTCIELLAAGYDIVVADNFYNSCPEAVRRVKQIAGKDFRFVEADMTDKAQVEKIFAENPDIDSVIQFAAYKAVGESVSKPIEYYSNNLNCTLNILDVMRRYNCKNFVFSSSATVYGDPASVPIREDFPVGGAVANTNIGASDNKQSVRAALNDATITMSSSADPSGAAGVSVKAINDANVVNLARANILTLRSLQSGRLTMWATRVRARILI